jgi:hypothetical protein
MRTQSNSNWGISQKEQSIFESLDSKLIKLLISSKFW